MLRAELAMLSVFKAAADADHGAKTVANDQGVSTSADADTTQAGQDCFRFRHEQALRIQAGRQGKGACDSALSLASSNAQFHVEVGDKGSELAEKEETRHLQETATVAAAKVLKSSNAIKISDKATGKHVSTILNGQVTIHANGHPEIKAQSAEIKAQSAEITPHGKN